METLIQSAKKSIDLLLLIVISFRSSKADTSLCMTGPFAGILILADPRFRSITNWYTC